MINTAIQQEISGLFFIPYLKHHYGWIKRVQEGELFGLISPERNRPVKFMVHKFRWDTARLVRGYLQAYYGDEFLYKCQSQTIPKRCYMALLFQAAPSYELTAGYIPLIKSFLAVPTKGSLIIKAYLQDDNSNKVIIDGTSNTLRLQLRYYYRFGRLLFEYRSLLELPRSIYLISIMLYVMLFEFLSSGIDYFHNGEACKHEVKGADCEVILHY